MKASLTGKGSLALLAVGTAAQLLTSCQEKKPLNVIYIMSDDHTSQAIGAYGSRLASLSPTPVLDSLASQGVVFEDAFCTNSISTPSRACIISGKYSHHNGVLTLDEKLDTTLQTLPIVFKKMGYQTAIIGKWHLKNEPAKFDFYKVLVGHGGQGEYFDPKFCTNQVTDKAWPKNIYKTKGHSSTVITDQTLDWLKNKRDKNKPFFLMHHYKAPHDMFEFDPKYKDYLAKDFIPEPESMYDRSKWGSVATKGANDSLVHFIGTSISRRHANRTYVEEYKITEEDDRKATSMAYQEYLKRYLRCVKGVDDNLSRLFNYLKEEGLWENTIIVYTGDQGMMLGEHDFQDKRWMYEESERMPLLWRVPGTPSVGTRSDLMISNIDYAPTLIELCGGEVPADMDGKSFASAFWGNTPENWKEEVYYRYYMHMIHHDIPAHLGVRTKDYKLILFYGRHFDTSRYGQASMWWLRNKNSHKIVPTPVAFELYDLKKDPHEMNNVANDPAYAEIFKDMKTRLRNKRQTIGDTDEKYPEMKAVIDAALAE